MKLDAKFYGEIRKVKDDSLVPEDEYVVFLVKDNAFADMIFSYRDRCVQLGCDKEQIDSINRMITRILLWRVNNLNKCKNPDAKGEKLLG